MTTIEKIKQKAEELFNELEAFNDDNEGNPQFNDILTDTIELENAVGEFLGYEEDEDGM
jgi:tetrahydromethanopterin S-methyltransferase subunit H